MTISTNRPIIKNRSILKATGLLLFALFHLHSFGQQRVHYEAGIVQLHNGQTVVGYIQKLDLSAMVSKVNFKRAITDENHTNYDTAQIKRFWIGNKDVFDLLRFSVNIPAEPVNAFAKVLVKGDATLYKTIHKGEMLYLVKRDNTLYVLQNDRMPSRKGSIPVAGYNYKERLLEAVGKSVSSKISAEKLTYSENNFIDLVSAYNNSVGSPNDIMLAKEKPVSFLLATVGAGLQQNDGKEIFLHTAHRTYFPDLSRNTSLNVGFNFYASKYTELITINFYDYEFNYTSLLFTVPVEVQHNLLNNAIRPFVSAGFTFAFNSAKDQFGNSENRILKNKVGVRPVYSGGVEADLAKNFMVKAAYRKEVFSHLVLVGIGYNFSK